MQFPMEPSPYRLGNAKPLGPALALAAADSHLVDIAVDTEVERTVAVGRVEDMVAEVVEDIGLMVVHS